jgi:hypothetical protein
LDEEVDSQQLKVEEEKKDLTGRQGQGRRRTQGRKTRRKPVQGILRNSTAGARLESTQSGICASKELSNS